MPSRRCRDTALGVCTISTPSSRSSERMNCSTRFGDVCRCSMTSAMTIRSCPSHWSHCSRRCARLRSYWWCRATIASAKSGVAVANGVDLDVAAEQGVQAARQEVRAHVEHLDRTNATRDAVADELLDEAHDRQ